MKCFVVQNIRDFDSKVNVEGMLKSSPGELLIATGNQGKLREFQLMLNSLPFKLHSLSEFPDVVEVDETGETFEENAAIKALAYASETRLWTLADDSGLEVDALGGAPGIFSSRYAGEGASDRQRIERLLTELKSTGNHERRARFVCAIALANAEGRLVNIFTGRCEGRIAHAPMGERGFGYDPVFIPDGFTQSFGELSDEIKQQISHRARAMRAMQDFLLSLQPAG
jgi:XTP/dITP diphosphohydrolase